MCTYVAGWHPGSSYPAVSVWRGTRGPVGTEAVFTTASEAGTLKKKKMVLEISACNFSSRMV